MVNNTACFKNFWLRAAAAEQHQQQHQGQHFNLVTSSSARSRSLQSAPHARTCNIKT